MALPSNAGQMPEDMSAEGLRADDSPRPTLLTARLPNLGEKEEGGSVVPAPKPQVFGATLNHNDDEEDLVESNSEVFPCNRKQPEELVKEEAFWSKAQEALEERAQREQLLRFLRKHRFKDVNTSSGWFFNFRFPLHAAVEDNDAEMVKVLLHFKARTKLKDAGGLSARQLARKKNENGTHEAILQILNEHTASRRKRAAARRAARVKTQLEGPEDAEEAPVNEGAQGQPDVGGSPEGI